MRLPRKPLLYTLLASLLVHLVLLLGPEIEIADFKPAPQLSVVLSEPAAPLQALRLQAKPRAAPAKRVKAKPPAPLPTTLVQAPAPELPTLPPSESAPVNASSVAVTESNQVAPATTEQPANVQSAANTTAPVPLAQREFPTQIQLVFNVYRGEQGLLLGKTTHRWRVVDKDYSISSTTEATGLFSLFFNGKYLMTSRGKLTEAGLQPSAFWVQRGREDRTEEAAFDWEAKILAYGKSNELQRAELSAGTQDQLSGMYQLALTAPHQGRVQVSLTTGRKLNQYEYQVIGNETIETPLGKFKAEHIASVKKAQDEDTGDIWLAIDQYYLPVRFKLTTRNGEVLDHMLAEVHITPP